MMRPSAPERDAESQWAEENEENEEPFSGSFSKKTPPKKTTISDWQNDYTFRLVVAEDARSRRNTLRKVEQAKRLLLFSIRNRCAQQSLYQLAYR